MESRLGESYICSICGEEHEGPVTDRSYTLPDIVWELPEAARSERARYNSDLCQFDGRNFIRCMLEIPFTETTGRFGWGVWAEVDLGTFDRYLELYDEDGSGEPLRSATLANELPAYPGSLGPMSRCSSRALAEGRPLSWIRTTHAASRTIREPESTRRAITRS